MNTLVWRWIYIYKKNRVISRVIILSHIMIATHQDNVDTDCTFDGVCAWKVREHGFRQLWVICDLFRYWINAKGSLWKNRLDLRLPKCVSVGDKNTYKKQQIKGKETLVAKLCAIEQESPYELESRRILRKTCFDQSTIIFCCKLYSYGLKLQNFLMLHTFFATKRLLKLINYGLGRNMWVRLNRELLFKVTFTSESVIVNSDCDSDV